MGLVSDVCNDGGKADSIWYQLGKVAGDLYGAVDGAGITVSGAAETVGATATVVLAPADVLTVGQTIYGGGVAARSAMSFMGDMKELGYEVAKEYEADDPTPPDPTPSSTDEGTGKVQSPYSHLEDPKQVGPGKDFTAAQKQKIIEENRKMNGGNVQSDESSQVLVKPQKSKKGVTPDPNEWQIDHIVPKSKGGSNSYSNAQVLSRAENRAKSDN